MTGLLRQAKVVLDAGSTARMAGRELQMRPADYGLVLVFLIFGGVFGWFANKAYASNSDVKTGKQRLRGYRKSRHRNGLITAILAFVIGVVMFGLHP